MPRTARGIALHVLVRVERDRAWADLALHAALVDSVLERRDRAFATELVYGGLRMRGRLDAALQQVLDRELGELEIGVRNLLRLGTYQLMCLPRTRAAVAVDETVKLARAAGFARASGFVNAVLRELSRRSGELSFPSLAEDAVGHVEQWGSLPRWLAERWVAELGPEEAAALALSQLEAPPRAVRVSPGADRQRLAKRLAAKPGRWAPDALTDCARDPVSTAAFRRGELTIQDEASQLVPLLLGAEPGDTVVDCCAAPGTKTVQLAQQVGRHGEVIALDVNPERLKRIGQAARRIGLENLRILERDSIRGFDLRGKLRFPRVLVDAPCTGLGVLRRNPDARWRLRAEDVAAAANTQIRLLDSAARYVEAGGVLVYSVCTISIEETSGVVSQFLDGHPDWKGDDPRPFLPKRVHELIDPSGALRTWPHRHGCDGFYAVRMVRS